MKTRKLSDGTIILIIFAAAVIVVGAVIFAQLKNFEANAQKTTAVITNIDVGYAYYHNGARSRDPLHNVYVEYSIDGAQYYATLDYYTFNMYEGQEVEIFYNPADPYEIHGSLAPIVAICRCGGLALLIALVVVFIRLKQKKSLKTVTDGGKCPETKQP